MKIKTILVGLLILIFSLPFLVSFLYSVVFLCGSTGCGMCGVIGHHIDKRLSFFTNILNSDNRLLSQFLLTVAMVMILVILFLRNYSQKYFINFKLYQRYKISNAFNSIFFSPIKRLYADAIIDPQIYS